MLSFSSKATENIFYKVTDEANTVVIAGNTNASASSGWTKNYCFINTLQYSKIRVWLQTTSSSGKISYIDDVRLENLMYPDEIKNPGFENDVSDWTNAGSATSVAATTAWVNSGVKAAFVTNRADQFSGIRQDVTSILNKYGSGSYCLDAWVKTATPLPTGKYVTIRVRWYSSSVPAETRQTALLNGTNGEYQHISAVLPITWTGTITAANITVETSGEEKPYTDFYVDDVSFFKMP